MQCDVAVFNNSLDTFVKDMCQKYGLSIREYSSVSADLMSCGFLVGTLYYSITYDGFRFKYKEYKAYKYDSDKMKYKYDSDKMKKGIVFITDDSYFYELNRSSRLWNKDFVNMDKLIFKTIESYRISKITMEKMLIREEGKDK